MRRGLAGKARLWESFERPRAGLLAAVRQHTPFGVDAIRAGGARGAGDEKVALEGPR